MPFSVEEYFYFAVLANLFCFLIMFILIDISKKQMDMEKAYVEAVLDEYKHDYISTIASIEAGLPKNTRLRRILKAAIKHEMKSVGQKRGVEALALVSLYLHSAPVKILNEILEHVPGKELPVAVKKFIRRAALEWEKQCQDEKRRAKEFLIKFGILRFILCVINLCFHIYFKNYESLEILVAVDIAGFIIQLACSFDDRYKIKEKNNAGNLAFIEWLIHTFCLNSEYSLQNAIIESYKWADNEIKSVIKPLVIEAGTEKIESGALIALIERYDCPELISIIDHMKKKDELAMDELGKYYLRQSLSKEKEKSEKARTNAMILKKTYDAVASLGLMLNVMQFLSQALATGGLI